MSKKDGMSFSKYADALNAHLPGEMGLYGDASRALDLMLSVITMSMLGQSQFSHPDVRVANHGMVSHPRDASEAANALALAKTKYDVFSYRLFMRNFDLDGNIIHHSSNYPVLGNEAFQIRFEEIWMGDKNGEPEEKIETLQAVMDTNAIMQKQVRQNFVAIDNRSVAMNRLERDQWTLRKMPIDVISMRLEHAMNPGVAIRNRGEGCTDIAELALLTTLDGNSEVLFRVDGRVAVHNELTSMNPIPAALLVMLPKKVEDSYKNYGSKKKFGFF